MHIGLIGGIGPAATLFYYRGLVDGHAAAGRRLDLTIQQAHSADMIANLMAGNAAAQGEIFAAIVERLAAAGAEVAAVTSMGGHFCIAELEKCSVLPLCNLVGEMAARLTADGHRRIAIMGTAAVMESHIYGAIPDIEVVLPTGHDLQATHDNYVTMASAGRVNEAQRDFFFRQGAALVRDQGAEVVVLGGTDLCLAFEGRDCGFPVLDSAAVHVDALNRLSLANPAA